MRGRDFTSLDEVLCDNVLEVLENKGENSVLEHTKLSEMYFESIWGIEDVRAKVHKIVEPFNIKWEAESQQIYYQMLFDLVSFYNLGNANQLYQKAIYQLGDSKVYPIHNCGFYNRKLSAYLYTLYFFNQVKGNDELMHLLFLHGFLFHNISIQKETIIAYCNTCQSAEGEPWPFIDYAESMLEGFYKGEFIKKEEMTKYVKSELEYFLSLQDAEMEQYVNYLQKQNWILMECEYLANQQKNYGLVETDFEQLLEFAM